MKTIRYLASLAWFNLKEQSDQPLKTLMLSVLMMIQNFMFFTLWIVFFGSIGQVKGWKLEDVAAVYGMIALAIGVSLLLADGPRTLGYKIQDGSIDAMLTKPRDPLPLVIFSRSNQASAGDIVSGILIYLVLGHAPWTTLPLFLLLGLMGAVIFSASTVLFYSFVFWKQKQGRFADQLFDALIIFSTIPQIHTPVGVKIMMYSVLPAGFITFMPVSLLKNFDPVQMAILSGATALYALLAWGVFRLGVRAYKS